MFPVEKWEVLDLNVWNSTQILIIISEQTPSPWCDKDFLCQNTLSMVRQGMVLESTVFTRRKCTLAVSTVMKPSRWSYKSQKGVAMYFTWPFPVTLLRVCKVITNQFWMTDNLFYTFPVRKTATFEYMFRLWMFAKYIKGSFRPFFLAGVKVQTLI